MALLLAVMLALSVCHRAVEIELPNRWTHLEGRLSGIGVVEDEHSPISAGMQTAKSIFVVDFADKPKRYVALSHQDVGDALLLRRASVFLDRRVQREVLSWQQESNVKSFQYPQAIRRSWFFGDAVSNESAKNISGRPAYIRDGNDDIYGSRLIEMCCPPTLSIRARLVISDHIAVTESDIGAFDFLIGCQRVFRSVGAYSGGLSRTIRGDGGVFGSFCRTPSRQSLSSDKARLRADSTQSAESDEERATANNYQQEIGKRLLVGDESPKPFGKAIALACGWICLWFGTWCAVSGNGSRRYRWRNLCGFWLVAGGFIALAISIGL